MPKASSSKPKSRKIKSPLLERAKREGTPLLDLATPDTAAEIPVTFVWEGKPESTPPAILGDFNQWGRDEGEAAQFIQAAPGVWSYTLLLPRNGYFEYIFTPDPADPKARLNDPLNKRRVSNGMGKFNNVIEMPGVRHTPLVNARKGIPRGVVTHHRIEHNFWLSHVRGDRDVWLYAPPVTEPVPLLVVYDGKDYLRRAKLPQIVDHLIAQERIQPIALAMIQNGRKARLIEYNTSESTLLLVTEHLLPLARAHLNLLDIGENPGAYGVLGASLGGLMAMYTGLRLPTIFGKVLSQSGSLFDFGKGGAVIQSWVKQMPLPSPALTIWQDVGLYEWLITANRSFNALLVEKGYNVTYREFAAGHNYTAWRDMLPEALVTTFGR
jgi:enterochelin esterase family protein